MYPQHYPASIEVADAIRAMMDAEVRALVDVAYACGMVQTLHHVTRVLANVELEVGRERTPEGDLP